MVFDNEKSKSYDLRHFTDAKNNLSQLIHDFDKYKYQVELKKEALKTEPGFLEKSINEIFDFIYSIIDKKDQVVSFIKSRINLVIEFNNRQILAFNRNGLKLTHKLEEYFLAFTNFRKNYRDKAFEASSKSVELLTNSVSNTTYIYSQTISSVKQVVPQSPQVLLRAAAIFGLVTALILPVNSIVAFAEETPTEVVSPGTPVESTPTSEPTDSPSPEPSASEAIEVGSEVIVEEIPVTEPSPSVEPSPEVTESASPTPSPSVSIPLVVVNAPTNLNFTPVVEGIKLTWDKTDSEIDKYIVKIDPDNRQVDVSKDASELLIADLDRKATYSFSIWAVFGEVSSEVTGPLTVDLSTVKFPRPPMNAEVGGLIVKFEDQELSSQDLTNIADTTQLQPVSLEVSSEIATDTHLVEFNQPVDVNTANEIADALEANNSVEYAELDFAFLTASEANTSESYVPNDPLYGSKQWSLWGNFGVGVADGPTGLALAYQSSTGLGSVVAVIDTGFTNHPDLEGQFVSGYDFVSNNEMLSGIRKENGNPVPYDGDYIDQATYGPIGWDNNPQDPGDWNSTRSSSWHGTYIAGLVAAKTNNGIGIAGIAPDAKIQPIRAFSWRGGLLSDVIASITWASGGTVENVPANQTPAKVINLSFSVEAPCTPSLQLAIDEAISRGSVVVAAAGNNNQDAANFAPGNCQNVITVGAINSDGEKAAYSNFGASVDLSAPGGELNGQAIYSTSNEGSTTSTNPAYVVRQGTSIATAQVSAAIAKLSQTYPTENAVQLKARVLSNEATKPFPTGKCLTDENCGLGYLFFNTSALPGARTGTNVNNELFLGGNYIELGISRKGNFGTSSSGGKPAGFNGAGSRNYIGMSADHDGFGVGTDNKNMDYFLPGTPEERFAYGYKVGATTTTRSNSELNSASNEPTTLTNTSSGDTLSATILTTWSSVMTVQQKIQFNVNDKFFRNEVTITNISGATMDSARFMRSFDPDNTVDSGGGSGFTTRNTINFQQPGDGKAQVTAESTSSFVIGSRATSTYPIVFYSTDTDARVATWGFANSNPYTSSAYESAGAKNSTVDADQAITITWQTSNLANNASDSFVYYTSLDQRDFNEVVAEVLVAEAAASSSISPTTQTVSGNVNSAITNTSSLTASNFTGTVSYAITSGTLPAGLTLDSTTGVISGTPTETSSSSVTITGTGSTSGSATTSITFSIAAEIVATGGGGASTPSITPSPTPIPTLSPTPRPRPTNVVINPLIIPTPNPSPTRTQIVIPGTITNPEPLVKKLIDEVINPLKPKIVDLFTSPTPRSTNASGTNTSSPTFDIQKALELAPSTQDKKVVELPSLVLINDIPEPSKVVIVDNNTAQIITPGGGLLNVAAKDGEERIPVDNRGRVQMVRENNVETEGKGMAPNSEFAVYLFSEPILLGIGKTDSKGQFFASFPVEDELPIGDHTLQVNGLLPDGKTASVSMPVVIVDSIETAKNQAMPKTIFVSENPVDKALRALYWMLIVLAVMMILIAAANRKRFFALFRRRDDEEENVQTI